MSNILSPIDNIPAQELDELLGQPADAITRDDCDLAIATLVGRARGQILEAMKTDGVGVRELARRLKVSPPAVSRQLRSEGDLRLSTAVVMAHALKRNWELSLKDPVKQGSLANYQHFAAPDRDVPQGVPAAALLGANTPLSAPAMESAPADMGVPGALGSQPMAISEIGSQPIAISSLGVPPHV